ncbi:flagellar basal body protein [Poseidonibacter antarcticus]|uniref:flagellar basal body protein n=1 Tax=Poseidonibacter antarcticus TaxID=2478538 RepID=UPI000EF478F8|nr:flagellar basal body protein [Poseidonibacter antarcticus]
MISSLWNGLSGLNTYEKALGGVSNNVANVSTVGHKSNNVRFEDRIGCDISYTRADN